MKKCQVISESTLFCQLVQQQLESVLQHPLLVIVDAPRGQAFLLRDAIQHQQSVIMSDNSCGEFLADLWELSPTVLISGQMDLDEFLFFCKQADKGKKHNLSPDYSSPLTPSERKILRLCAWSMQLDVVASLLAIRMGTLKNALSQIYGKLELSGFKDISPYYFGGLEKRTLFEKIKHDLIDL